MSLFTSEEIGQALNQNIKRDFSVDNVSIDSRKKTSNSLFIPIKGEKFDGHDFINEALVNGAEISLCCKSHLAKRKIRRDKIIEVDDTLISLQKLAKFSRNRASKTILIGITGSNGKTTLKNWSYEVFKRFFKTYASFGNYNNQIGLPLSLCNMPKETDICILELGTNAHGEIDLLARICKPNISIITNIGNAHIGNFKTEKKIAYEKSSIFKYFKYGDALIPGDSKYYNILKKVALDNNRRVYAFGSNKDCKYRIDIKKNSENNNTINFKIDEKRTTVKWLIPGIHYIYNALIIFTLAKILKINLLEIKRLLPNLRPTDGRGSIHKLTVQGKKVTLFDESYNANPDSMLNALKILELSSTYRRICVIGEMLELGPKSQSFHLEICKKIMKTKVDVVLTIGKEARTIYENLSKFIIKKHFNKIDDLYNYIVINCKDQDRILVKGSNSANLSLITKKLVSEF
tara:strand:- start:8696 stop:10078 length:1383 start_codon:yes stop_codon:yes gene_type:complete